MVTRQKFCLKCQNLVIFSHKSHFEINDLESLEHFPFRTRNREAIRHPQRKQLDKNVLQDYSYHNNFWLEINVNEEIWLENFD